MITSNAEIREKSRAIANSLTNPIAVFYRGSFAHGTYIENHIDDIDILGVCIAPLNCYFGLNQFGSRGTIEKFEDAYDVTVYEFLKMVSLLASQNPNVLSSLWLPDEFLILKTKEWDILRANRNLFLSKQPAYDSFTGYAHSQLKRMTTFKFEGYMGAKRKEIVEKLGYDAKNAAHLIRLLRLGIEFLRFGKMTIDRREIDADELVTIKLGRVSLEEIKKMADSLFYQAKQAYYSSPLPEKLDRQAISDLATCILREYFYE